MIRIGLLGASRIADKAIFQVLPLLNGFTVQAVAASNKAKAQAYADIYPINHVAENYQLLEFKCAEFAEEYLYGEWRKEGTPIGNPPQ